MIKRYVICGSCFPFVNMTCLQFGRKMIECCNKLWANTWARWFLSYYATIASFCCLHIFLFSAAMSWFFSATTTFPVSTTNNKKFSCDEQLKKWRCHSVRPSVRLSVTLFYYSRKWTYGALKPHITISI